MAVDRLFEGFHVTTPVYKKVDGHEITINVLIPKSVRPGKLPLIVRWHGGFLTTGSSLYTEWFPSWLLDYALFHSAIIVCPNYRLMPEVAGLDFKTGVFASWTWVYNDLQTYLGKNVEVDMDRVLVEGEEAGGYLVMQSALTHVGKVKAIIGVSPMIDLKIPFFTQAHEKNMIGFPALPGNAIETHMLSLKGGEIVSSVTPPDRMDLAILVIQQGKFVEMIGDDTNLFPMERLDLVKNIPPMFMIHGKNDSMVPYRSSEAFVEKMKKTHPHVKVLHNAVPGCEHRLDLKADLDTSWLKEGLDFITRFWLGT